MTMRVGDRLRLKLEDAPTSTTNLIPNPSGVLGGWGWLTPAAGGVMTSGGTDAASSYLAYSYSRVAAAGYFESESFVVTPLSYVMGAWDGFGGTTPNYAVLFAFFDSAGNPISTSATTSAFSGAQDDPTTVGTLDTRRHYTAAYQVPAGATRARLRFTFPGQTTGSPTFTLRIRAVTVNQHATSSFTFTRTNLLTNGSFASNTTGWESVQMVATPTATYPSSNVTLARTSAQAWTAAGDSFSCSLTVTAAGSADFSGARWNARMPVSEDELYTVSAYFRGASTTRQSIIYFSWFDADQQQIGASAAKAGAGSNSGSWARTEATVQAPVGAAFLEVWVGVITPTVTGEVHYIDAVMVEKAYGLRPYINTTASGTGIDLISDLAAFVDVLSPTSSITVDRDEWQVGTLTANLLTDFDESTIPDLLPGRRVRLLWRPETVTETTHWAPLFTGRLRQAQTSYDLLNKNADHRAQITLTATDAVTDLAQNLRASGVKAVTDLPWLLEGCGAPWNCNGVTGQYGTSGYTGGGSTPTIVSVNDQATAADQVMLTRDSTLGYAWVSKAGVVTVYDAATMPTSSPITLDESDYLTDLALDLDTDRVINDVAITLLQYDASNGQTGEKQLGPYRDEDSIATYGDHQVTYTVQGLTDAQVDALGAAILANNGTPARTVDSLSVKYGTAELYDLIRITNATASLDVTRRIVSIHHEISAAATSDNPEGGRWVTTYGFIDEDANALPQLLPDSTKAEIVTSASFVTYPVVWSCATGAAPALNNGTLVGAYHLDGEGWCDFFIELTIGSSTTLGGGTWQFSLPMDPADHRWLFSDCEAFDSSATSYYDMRAALNSTTGSTLTTRTSSGASAQLLTVNATSPFAWAAGDVATISGRFPVG